MAWLTAYLWQNEIWWGCLLGKHNSQAVGHREQQERWDSLVENNQGCLHTQWDEMRWEHMTDKCHSHSFELHDTCQKTMHQKKCKFQLTSCSQVISSKYLIRKGKFCLLPVGHRMGFSETGSQKTMKCHFLLSMGWGMLGVIQRSHTYCWWVGEMQSVSWQKHRVAASLTFCLLWEDMWWDYLADECTALFTCFWTWDEMEWNCIQNKCSTAHSLLIMGEVWWGWLQE